MQSPDDDDDDSNEVQLTLAPKRQCITSAQIVNQPSTEEETVRSLIDKQRFDGLWSADEAMIQTLTGKSWSTWQSAHPDIDSILLNSLIILLVLEQRFAKHSSLWFGIVQKARKAIVDQLTQDAKNIDTYLTQIRLEL